MKRLKIVNARVFAPERSDGAILIEDGRVVDVAAHCGGFGNCQTLDAAGLTAAPGFIDLHAHGGGGRSVMDGDPQSVVHMANAHARCGTTTILPTAWTAPLLEIERAIDAVRAASAMPCDATIAGINLEGPFLSPAQAGAQQREALRTPADADWRALLDRWDGIRIVGAAPELDGALALGDELRRRGVVASIAHSDAYEADVRRAVAHGFCDVTHLYSGCSTFARRFGFRDPGVVECALAFDELTVEVIADGRHLPDAMLRLIWRAKGAEKMILITDALEFAAAPLVEGGAYRQQNGLDVIYEDGVMKLASRQAFAGSVATTDRLLRVAVGAGIPLAQALAMLTVNPARRIGLDARKGRIRPGYDADIAFLDGDLQIAGCMARGKLTRWERNERR